MQLACPLRLGTEECLVSRVQRAVATFTRLTTFSFSEMVITDELLTPLTTATTLNSLSFYDCRISTDMQWHFNSVTSLTDISFFESSTMDGVDVLLGLASIHSLTRLNFQNCCMNGQTQTALSSLTKLRELDLYRTDFLSDNLLLSLTEVAPLRTLHVIPLQPRSVSNGGVAALASMN